jgi:hypothetical protein
MATGHLDRWHVFWVFQPTTYLAWNGTLAVTTTEVRLPAKTCTVFVIYTHQPSTRRP